MIGGVATNLHGFQRPNEDIDPWIKDSKQDKEILRKVFSEYGMGELRPYRKCNSYLDGPIHISIMGSDWI